MSARISYAIACLALDSSTSFSPLMNFRFRAHHPLAFLAITLGIFGTASGCGSLTDHKASFENTTDTVTVYALNGTPASTPAGLSLIGRSAVVINAGFGFDVAFDIDAQGQTTMYTVRYVAGGLSGAHTVALQRYTGKFDDLLKAPTTGYVSDSLLVAKVGDVVALSSADPLACAYSIYSNVIYAKLEILDIDPVARTVRSRFTVDPNCGFLSLIPSGIPKD
jgi:hypothetical protein